MTRPTICIVGPVAPYRGGISQYTESLREALRERADVHTFSFSKQYPQRLYPGETDQDPEMVPHDDVRYVLDATSPASWRRCVREMAALKPDLVLINWWTLYWQPWTAWMAARLRRRGIRVVFICHNIGDHGAGGLRKRAGAMMLARADGFIVHSRELEADVQQRVPGAEVLRRPMPAFDRFPDAVEKWPSRKRLELLFFGFIRPYKGLDVLLDAFAGADRENVALSVVGESWEDSERLRARAAELGVDLVLEYVSDGRAAEYFHRADAVVLPYVSAAGSAVVAAAFAHGRPVIASRVGGIPDVVTPETGWLTPAGDVEALREAIASVTRESAAAMRPAVRRVAAELSWTEFAGAVVARFVEAEADDSASGESAALG